MSKLVYLSHLKQHKSCNLMAGTILKNEAVQCGAEPLTLEDFHNILFDRLEVELDEDALLELDKNFKFLQKFSKDKVIYGINTGFGSMSQYRIADADQVKLQYNLIRSHCAGAGNSLPDSYVKSIMLVRLATLMLGYSGIHKSVAILLKDFINNNIYPEIFEHGSVGASGDLVQLAHLGLALIGEGEVKHNGRIKNSGDVLKQSGLEPIEIHIREGLAIMNGTAAMTGIGVVNVIRAKNLLDWMIAASVMINEIVESYDDHLSKELNVVKKHRGQNRIAKVMRELVQDSQLIRRREEYLYNGKSQEDVLEDKVQEYYSLRCVPQILGPIYDTLINTEKVLLEEVNSVNDNPVIDSNNQNVYHGGNFHGDYVALEMDKLKTVITKLSMLSERQLNFLVNDKLNNKLPPFVNLGRLGFNFGMQGVQFTSTSTTAENQTLSFPMYVHSIPSNNDNQDIVSMGTNAALITRKVIENSYEVVAIELIAIMQAIDFLNIQDQLSGFSKNIHGSLRQISPKFINDSAKYKDVANVKEHILANVLNLIP